MSPPPSTGQTPRPGLSSYYPAPSSPCSSVSSLSSLNGPCPAHRLPLFLTLWEFLASQPDALCHLPPPCPHPSNQVDKTGWTVFHFKCMFSDLKLLLYNGPQSLGFSGRLATWSQTISLCFLLLRFPPLVLHPCSELMSLPHTPWRETRALD